jgi:hypothetical protein
MDQENAATPSANITTLARKSWTAYVRVTIVGIFLLAIMVPIAWQMSRVAGPIALIATLAYLAYAVLTIRSYHLFFDDMGVWLQRGILPWNSGLVGVKWRDVDEAVYFQNIWSWMFKSYTIRVGHRFTKSSELIVSHMARGHEAVMTVNSLHQSLVRENRLA